MLCSLLLQWAFGGQVPGSPGDARAALRAIPARHTHRRRHTNAHARPMAKSHYSILLTCVGIQLGFPVPSLIVRFVGWATDLQCSFCCSGPGLHICCVSCCCSGLFVRRCPGRGRGVCSGPFVAGLHICCVSCCCSGFFVRRCPGSPGDVQAALRADQARQGGHPATNQQAPST